MLALFTRAEARDFIDVVLLARRYGFERLCELGEEKDPGFHLAALADALGSLSRIPRRAADVDDDTLDEISGGYLEYPAGRDVTGRSFSYSGRIRSWR